MDIDRRRFLEMMAGTASAALLGASGAGTGRSPRRRPNVLVIQPDQHRGMTLGCAGDEQAITPHLDRLAGEGIRFSHAVSCCPVCAPFRATMQTGMYSHRHGVFHNGLKLNPRITGFAEVFARSGYATGYIGKWDIYGHSKGTRGGYVPAGPDRKGWREWHGYESGHEYFDVWRFDEQQRQIPVEDYDWEPTWHTDMMLDFAARQRDAGRPWLYYVSYGPPHRPEQCPKKYIELFPPEAFRLPPDLEGKLSRRNEAQLRRIWSVYYGQVTALDHEVGRLVSGLEELGVADDTIVLYCSDHGDRLGSHSRAAGGGESHLRGKAVPHATVFRIPLIVRWPAAIEPGQVCDALVASVDLSPTILTLAGLEVPEQMQGMSMDGWCLRGDGPRRDSVYLGLGIQPAGWRAIWDGRYLLSRGHYRALYDHQQDPYELRNLRASPDRRKLVHELAARLEQLAAETQDPYLDRVLSEDSLES